MADRLTDKEYSRPTYASDYVKHDTERAVYLGHPMIDNLVEAVVALGAEVWTTRKRQKILEALLEEKGITGEMIETYMPSDEQMKQWGEDRDELVERTLHVLARQGDLPLSADWPSQDEHTGG